MNDRLAKALEYKAPPLTEDEIRSVLRWYLKGAEARARRFNIPYNLHMLWALDRYTGYCEISGIPFEPWKSGKGRSMFALSIDQIKPRGGYTTDNCRFILWCLNMMLGNVGTEQDIIRVAEGVVRKHSTDSQLLTISDQLINC